MKAPAIRVEPPPCREAIMLGHLGSSFQRDAVLEQVAAAAEGSASAALGPCRPVRARAREGRGYGRCPGAGAPPAARRSGAEPARWQRPADGSVPGPSSSSPARR